MLENIHLDAYHTPLNPFSRGEIYLLHFQFVLILVAAHVAHHHLVARLKTDVYVMNAVKEDVMRIANASYYVGRGDYELFVLDSENEIVKRKVQLGDSNFEYVEVISGLQPGDQVVVSDMSSFKNKNKLKVE